MTSNLTVQTTPDAVVVRLKGDVDVMAAPRIETQVQAAVGGDAPRCLIVDLSDVSYVDSSGIELLFRLHQVVAPAETSLMAVAPKGTIAARLFDIVVLDAIAEVCRTVDEALGKCVG